MPAYIWRKSHYRNTYIVQRYNKQKIYFKNQSSSFIPKTAPKPPPKPLHHFPVI